MKRPAWWRRPQTRAEWVGLLALLGWLGLAVGFIVDGRRALHSYLAVYVWALSLALGALCFLAIVNAMNATWPVAIRRLAEQIAATLPLFAVFFLPVFIGMRWLFPWMTPERFDDPHLRELVIHRRAYLNPAFFSVRWVIVFAVWIVLAWVMRHWSLRQRHEPGDRLRQRLQLAGVAGLIPLGLTLTIASFDWVMSLTPTWYSSMFGIYFFAGSFVGGLALITLVAAWEQGYGRLSELRRPHFYAMGRLLLAFTSFWAYTAFFQYMLIWIANRPLEGAWFVQREAGSWRGLSVALIIGHFAVPFLVLLSYRIKQDRRWLAPIAAWIVLFHFVDAYWLVMPACTPQGFHPGWTDLAAIFALGGSTAVFARFLLRSHPLLPLGDPVLQEALDYQSS
jgi:hypothetical protein